MKVFSADEVAQALPLGKLVEALRSAFRQGAQVPPRHAHAVGEGNASLLMPAWHEGGCYALKVVNVFPANAALGLSALHAVVLLFDARTGVPLAQLDGAEITSRRTAAASALAASYLLPQQPTRLLVVGTGRVARLLPAAYAAVRPLHSVAVWGRRPETAAALCAQLQAQGLDAQPCTRLEEGVRAATAVSCATLAEQALIKGAWLQNGQHLDLIGSFAPHMREADGQAVRRSRVFVDTEEALAKSGDLLSAIAEGCFSPPELQGTLAQLCRGECAGRGGAQEITLFKSVGTALEDLAAAQAVWQGAAH